MGKEMGLGKKVEVLEWKERKARYEVDRQGKIIGIYPHIIHCEMKNGIKECFRMNEIEGNEYTKVRVKE